MITAILTIVASVVSIVALLAEAYMKMSPDRKAKKREEEIAQGRIDLSTGNIDAVQSRIDKLLTEGDSDARKQDG